MVFCLLDFGKNLASIGTLEWQITAHEDVKKDTERPDVALIIIIAIENLWSHVIRRTSNIMKLFSFLGPLRETEVNNLDLIVGCDHNILWFDISMDDSLLVDDLDSLDHLDGDVEASLEVKFSSALLEVVFETLTEEVHDHDVVHLTILCLLIADEMQIGNRRLASQLVNQF